MIEICDYNKCTGCAACANICGHNAILMQQDVFGETHPYIDHTLCVDCGLCQKCCPNNNKPQYNYPIKCYAAFRTDKDKRRISASGGLGALMSEFVISIKKGVVFGTSYDNNLIPRTNYAENIEDIESFKGSKYVQSVITEDLFKQVRAFLKNDRFVLYIGTPCQIAGLKGYLRREYDNLLTVDLICHGVCPTCYLSEEIDYLCQKYNIRKNEISDIRFRGNDTCKNSLIDKILGRPATNNYVLSLWKDTEFGKERVYFGELNKNYYLTGFLKGVSMRENCYTCNYACPERISDITIGDFIGLSDTPPFPYPKGNVSSVTTNTQKGVNFYNEILLLDKSLVSVERDYNERLKYKPSLVSPFPRHHLNGAFRQIVQEKGYISAIQSVLKKEMSREYRISKFRWFIFLPIRSLKSIIKRMLLSVLSKEQLKKIKKVFL